MIAAAGRLAWRRCAPVSASILPRSGLRLAFGLGWRDCAVDAGGVARRRRPRPRRIASRNQQRRPATPASGAAAEKRVAALAGAAFISGPPVGRADLSARRRAARPVPVVRRIVFARFGSRLGCDISSASSASRPCSAASSAIWAADCGVGFDWRSSLVAGVQIFLHQLEQFEFGQRGDRNACLAADRRPWPSSPPAFGASAWAWRLERVDQASQRGRRALLGLLGGWAGLAAIETFGRAGHVARRRGPAPGERLRRR